MDKCGACKGAVVQTEYGSMVCTRCGVENFESIFDSRTAYMPYCVPLVAPASYTRQKRFRKYLQRAAMQQSGASVPRSTWEYLFKRAPFKTPRGIISHLKNAPKNIRKKCYDCLPLLIKTLCPHLHVPTLPESDKYQALAAFRELDHAYTKGEPFVSYLFALEYILQLIGRSALLPFINKIQCRKRRLAYRCRLDAIFKRSSRAGSPGRRVACSRRSASCSRPAFST